MPEPQNPMPWTMLVDLAKDVGDVGGRVSALSTAVRDLTKTVAAHDESDQDRHLDLLKAGEARQVAVADMIAASNKPVMAALDALAKRLDEQERQAQEAKLAEAEEEVAALRASWPPQPVAPTAPTAPTAAQAEQDAVAAAKPFFAVLMAVPVPIWAGSAMFIAAIIAGVLGQPVKWPDPPKLDPPVAVVPEDPEVEEVVVPISP